MIQEDRIVFTDAGRRMYAGMKKGTALVKLLASLRYYGKSLDLTEITNLGFVHPRGLTTLIKQCLRTGRLVGTLDRDKMLFRYGHLNLKEEDYVPLNEELIRSTVRHMGGGKRIAEFSRYLPHWRELYGSFFEVVETALLFKIKTLSIYNAVRKEIRLKGLVGRYENKNKIFIFGPAGADPKKRIILDKQTLNTSEISGLSLKKKIIRVLNMIKDQQGWFLEVRDLADIFGAKPLTTLNVVSRVVRERWFVGELDRKTGVLYVGSKQASESSESVDLGGAGVEGEQFLKKFEAPVSIQLKGVGNVLAKPAQPAPGSEILVTNARIIIRSAWRHQRSVGLRIAFIPISIPVTNAEHTALADLALSSIRLCQKRGWGIYVEFDNHGFLKEKIPRLRIISLRINAPGGKNRAFRDRLFSRIEDARSHSIPSTGSGVIQSDVMDRYIK